MQSCTQEKCFVVMKKEIRVINHDPRNIRGLLVSHQKLGE